jgi:hypothetical protein
MAGGQSITVSQGSVASGITIGLTGLAIASATGFMSGTAPVDVALTGSEVTASQGSLGSARFVALRSRKVGGGAAVRALVGQSATVSQGTASPNVSKALTGLAIASAQGSLGKTRTRNITGQAIGLSTGTMTPANQGLTWTGNIFPMTVNRGSFFDLAPFISDPLSELVNITPNVALPTGVAITSSPTWRVTATAAATLGATSGMNLTLVKNATADFTARASGPDVVWWHNFDTAAEVNQFRWTGGYGSGNDPLGQGQGANQCFWVASGGADGGGFMRLSYPVGTSNGSSYWWRPYAPFNGAGNGKGTNDPGASGTIPVQSWNPTNGGNQTSEFTTNSARPAFYGHATAVAANPTKFDGTTHYLQVRIRRAQTPGGPPDNEDFTNIVGKSFWPNVTTSTSTAQELVFYGQSPADSVGTQSRLRIYEGVNRSGGPSIGGNSMTTTIDNNDNVNDWRFSGGWDTILMGLTPGTHFGTGTNRTRLEVWAQHDPTLFPAESGVYTKVWDVLYSAGFDQGPNSVGAPNWNGWNAVLLAIYHNGAVFTTSSFNFDYDQIIFSKATIAAPTA